MVIHLVGPHMTTGLLYSFLCHLLLGGTSTLGLANWLRFLSKSVLSYRYLYEKKCKKSEKKGLQSQKTMI